MVIGRISILILGLHLFAFSCANSRSRPRADSDGSAVQLASDSGNENDAGSRANREPLPKAQIDRDSLFLLPAGVECIADGYCDLPMIGHYAIDGGVTQPQACDSSSDCPEGIPCLPSGYCDVPLITDDYLETHSDAASPFAPWDAAILSLLDANHASDNVLSCSANSDCELLPLDCCYSCEPAYSTFEIFNLESAEKERERCRGVTCEDECAGLLLPTIKAICMQGRCAKMDLRDNTVSTCKSSSDCRVRTVDCCECGASTAPGYLIAVSNEAAYRNLVCDADWTCDVCNPSYPPEVTAVCIAGRCQAADPRP
jgi:hypothetical protein